MDFAKFQKTVDNEAKVLAGGLEGIAEESLNLINEIGKNGKSYAKQLSQISKEQKSDPLRKASTIGSKVLGDTASNTAKYLNEHKGDFAAGFLITLAMPKGKLANMALTTYCFKDIIANTASTMYKASDSRADIATLKSLYKENVKEETQNLYQSLPMVYAGSLGGRFAAKTFLGEKAVLLKSGKQKLEHNSLCDLLPSIERNGLKFKVKSPELKLSQVKENLTDFSKKVSYKTDLVITDFDATLAPFADHFPVAVKQAIKDMSRKLDCDYAEVWKALGPRMDLNRTHENPYVLFQKPAPAESPASIFEKSCKLGEWTAEMHISDELAPEHYDCSIESAPAKSLFELYKSKCEKDGITNLGQIKDGYIKDIVDPYLKTIEKGENEYLKPYDSVIKTLLTLYHKDIPVEVLSDAPAFAVARRVQKSLLTNLVKKVTGRDLPDPSDTLVPEIADLAKDYVPKYVESQIPQTIANKLERIPHEGEKPEPTATAKILKRNDVAPSKAIFVGDSRVKDGGAAQQVSNLLGSPMRFLWARYGSYGTAPAEKIFEQLKRGTHKLEQPTSKLDIASEDSIPALELMIKQQGNKVYPPQADQISGYDEILSHQNRLNPIHYVQDLYRQYAPNFNLAPDFRAFNAHNSYKFISTDKSEK